MTPAPTLIKEKEIVVSSDLESIFKVTKIEKEHAYGFNLADNNKFVKVPVSQLSPVRHTQKAIRYLINVNVNKYEIAHFIVKSKPKAKTKEIADLCGYSIRQIMRFKQDLKP